MIRVNSQKLDKMCLALQVNLPSFPNINSVTIKNMNNIKKFVLFSVLAFVLSLVTLIPTDKVNAQSQNILIGRDMSIGSTGTDVSVLQGLLSELGYLNVPAGVPFGYFGPLTQQAVVAYQRARLVSPSSGYFGPITKLAMRGHFTPNNWLNLLGWN